MTCILLASATYAERDIIFEAEKGFENPLGGYVVPVETPVTATMTSPTAYGGSLGISGGDTSGIFEDDILNARYGGNIGKTIWPLTRRYARATWYLDYGGDPFEEKIEPLWIVNDIAPNLGPEVFRLPSGPYLTEQPIRIGFDFPADLMEQLRTLPNLSGRNEKTGLEVNVTALGKFMGRFNADLTLFNSWMERGEDSPVTIFAVSYPGTYELELRVSSTPFVLARTTIKVEHAGFGDNYYLDYPPPVEAYPGYRRSMHFPEGDEVRLEGRIPVELRWERIDPKAPDVDFDTVSQELLIVQPFHVPETCVSDIGHLRSLSSSVHLEHKGGGVFAGEIVTDWALEYGKNWVVPYGFADREIVDTIRRPLLGAHLLDLTPPDWAGDLQITQVGFESYNQDPVGFSVYNVVVNGVTPDQFSVPPELQVATNIATLAGGMQLGSDRRWDTIESEIDWESGVLSATLKLQPHVLLQGANVTLTTPCKGRFCGSIELARVPVPVPEGIAPDDWRGLVEHQLPDHPGPGNYPDWPQNDLVICGQEPVQSELTFALKELAAPPQPRNVQELVFDVINNGQSGSVPAQFEVWFEGQKVADNAKVDFENALWFARYRDDSTCEILHNWSPDDPAPPPKWGFKCDVPALESDQSRPYAFAVEMPRTGFVRWDAKLTAQDGAELHAEEGNLDLPPPRQVSDPRPKIFEVVPVRPQTGRAPDGDLWSYYPDPKNPNTTMEDRDRKLVIIGKNLPQRRSETVITSGEEHVLYHFHSSPETLTKREMEYHTALGVGLQRYFETDKPTAEILAMMAEQELEALVIEANFDARVFPGLQSFELNGTQGFWSLDFADVTVDLHFMRQVMGDPSNDDPPVEDRLREAYLYDTVRLVAAVSPPSLKLPYVDAFVLTPGPDGTGQRRVDLRLTRQELNSGEAYVSAPLGIDLPGSAMSERDLEFKPTDEKHALLRGFVDLSFAGAMLPAAQGSQANLVIKPSPAPKDETLWWNALHVAAFCNDIDLEPSEITQQNFESVESLSNWILVAGLNRLAKKFQEGFQPELIPLKIYEAGTGYEQNVRLGHHAALLMLRDEFVRLSTEQQRHYELLLADFVRMQSLFLGWRNAVDSLYWDDPRSPLFNIKVPGLAEVPAIGADPIEFGRLVRGSAWLEAAIKEGASQEVIADYLERSMKLAVIGLVKASREARVDAESIKDCDIEELAKLTAGFGPVRDSLMPRLMRRPNPSKDWELDMPARLWLASATELAITYFDQRDADATSDKLELLLLGLFTAPIGGIEFMILEATAQSAVNAYEYADRKQEFTRALGMTPVIGDGRYRIAKKNLVSLRSLIAQVATNYFLVGVGNIPQLLQLKSINRGAKIADELRGAKSLDEITPSQRQDLEVYLSSVEMKAFRDGPASLSPAERETFVRFSDDRGSLNGPRKAPDSTPQPGRETDPLPTLGTPGKPPPGFAAYENPLDPTVRLGRPREHVEMMNGAGRSTGNLPVMPHYSIDPRGPSAPKVLTGVEGGQELLDAALDDYKWMLGYFPPSSIENYIARMQLQALRDPRTLVDVIDDMSHPYGQTRVVGEEKEILVSLNRARIRERVKNEASRQGSAYGTSATLGHEVVHVIQIRGTFNAPTTGPFTFRWGVAASELHATLVEAVIQNAVNLRRGKPALDTATVVKEALEYSMRQQYRRFIELGEGSYRLRDIEAAYMELAQMDHKLARDMVQAYLPGMDEKAIIEAFLEAQWNARINYLDKVKRNPYNDVGLLMRQQMDVRRAALVDLRALEGA